MCVLVDVTLCICNLDDCIDWVNIHDLDTVRRTARNLNEHRVNESEQLNASLMTQYHAHPVEGESTAGCVVVCMSSQACASASSIAGAAVVVNVSNQAMLGSPIAGQVNVSDAVSQVVKVLQTL